MKKPEHTGKNIGGNIVSSHRLSTPVIVPRLLLIAGLAALGTAACSSEPVVAPWKRADDSPWSAKHQAELKDIPPDEQVTGETAAVAEPVAQVEVVEKVAVEPTEPVPETPPVVAQSTEQKILALPASYYAVQVYASQTEASMEAFQQAKGLTDLHRVRTRRDGKTIYVLIDIHPDLASARQAVPLLEEKAGASPWVRSMASLQKIIDE